MPLAPGSLRPRQNGRYFADDIFKCILLIFFSFVSHFHLSWFLRIPLTIHHWFRFWFVALRATKPYKRDVNCQNWTGPILTRTGRFQFISGTNIESLSCINIKSRCNQIWRCQMAFPADPWRNNNVIITSKRRLKSIPFLGVVHIC